MRNRQSSLKSAQTDSKRRKERHARRAGTNGLAHTVSPLLRLAWKSHESGKLAEAEALYRLLQETAPNDADTLRSLGTLAHSSKRLTEAVDLLKRSLEINPANAQTHVNLADVLKLMDEHDTAIEHYRQAIKLSPGFSQAWIRLSAAYYGQKRYAEAADTLKRYMANEPDDPEAYQNLGLVLAAEKKLDEAVAAYRRGLSIKADHVGLLSNLAMVLSSRGDHDEALSYCERAIAIDDNFFPAYLTRANVFLAQKRALEAIADFRRAAEIVPEMHEIHSSLGLALADVGKTTEAVKCFWRAVDLKPDLFDAYICALFYQNYDFTSTPFQYRQLAQRYGDAVMAGVTPWLHAAPSANSRPDRRIRVGFVSGDLLAHPVGYFLENVVAHLDKGKLDLYAYSLSITEDDVTTRLKQHFEHWTSLIEMTPRAGAQVVHDDRIDILIDLSGLTSKTGLPLFAWKPAPIQASWIGYFATTGVPTMDYFIGDRFVLPEGEAAHFLEKPLRLPRGYLCFKAPSADVPVTVPPSAGGQPTITFGCFNNLRKINDSVIALWARLLHEVAGSRLMLKNNELKIPSNAEDVIKRFAAQGIGAERLILEGPSPRAEYLASYNRVDVVLDPFPYNGGTTTVEALWMGVPVVVLRGDRFVAHMGEGILNHLGHPEWIAADANNYVTLAATLARDSDRLAQIKAHLREELLASPLCDGPGFARQFEEALTQVWSAHCAQALSDPAARVNADMAAAEAMQREERFEDAERIYRRILQLQPNHPDANLNLGILEIQRARMPESLAHFKTALEAAPKRQDFWEIYIEALKLAGHTAAAHEAFTKGKQFGVPLADSLAASFAHAVPVSAEVSALVREFEATLRALEENQSIDTMQAIALQMTQLLPDHGLGWKALGYAKLKQGHVDEAWEPLETASRLLPHDDGVRGMLGKVTAFEQARQLALNLQRKGEANSVRQILAQLQVGGWTDLTLDTLARGARQGIANPNREPNADVPQFPAQ